MFTPVVVAPVVALLVSMLVSIGWFLAKHAWAAVAYYALMAVSIGSSLWTGIVEEVVSTTNEAVGYTVMRRTIPTTAFLIVAVTSLGLALLLAVFWLGHRHGAWYRKSQYAAEGAR